jgi:hypothetical protein
VVEHAFGLCGLDVVAEHELPPHAMLVREARIGRSAAIGERLGAEPEDLGSCHEETPDGSR